MEILYVPIDERPCNTHIVERIANTAEDIKLLLPPNEFFGNKKTPSDTEKIWEWINNEAVRSDAIILSIDMLVYGGLIPSRLHELTEDKAVKWMNRLRSLRKKYSNLPIYASNMIMRTPKYSSSDEEPDYYEDWGKEIYLQAYLHDKSRRVQLSAKEKDQLAEIQNKLPQNFVEDYEKRRQFNSMVNEYVLDLVKEGVISFLVIPQDDSAEFGYTAIDQKVIVSKREQLRLDKQVLIYPGADEVGATLLARVYNDVKGYQPKIYPIWSSTLGPTLIPMYEDRPFAESMKAHIYAAGCRMVERPEDADLVLAYNVPGRVMQEAWDQPERDVTYSSYRNMLLFVEQIKKYIEQGMHVIIADSAFANGGDSELVRLLDNEEILSKLLSYKGWNTNCNTLGTTISQGVIGQFGHSNKIQENIIYHLLDDFLYQTEIRMQMVSDYLPKHDLNYFDLKRKADIVNQERDKRLQNSFNKEFVHSFQHVKIEQLKTYAPWNRMFECGIDLKVNFG